MRRFLPLAAALALFGASLPLAAQVCSVRNGTWTTRAPFPVNVVRAWGQFFPANGKFYALGGRFADGVGNDLLNPREYDPATDSWATKAASFSNAQVNNVVGGVLNVGGTDSIIVVGGSAGGQTTTTDEVRLYDPVADTMSIQASDPWPGALSGTTLPGGAAVFNNKLYVFGGFTVTPGSMVSTIFEYDPAQAVGSRWQQKSATLPLARGYIPTATVGNFIYLFGGSDFVGGTLADTNQSLRYDPLLDSISAVATIPRATAETRAVAQTDGTVWVLGGGRTAPNPSGQVDIYDPVGDAWSTGTAIPTARRNFPADLDPATGTLWAVGGYDATGVTAINVNEELSCVIFVDGFESGSTTAWSATVP